MPRRTVDEKSSSILCSFFSVLNDNCETVNALREACMGIPIIYYVIVYFLFLLFVAGYAMIFHSPVVGIRWFRQEREGGPPLSDDDE